MSDKRYRICMSAPLGKRDGIMFIHEADGKVDGWIEILNQKNAFFGRVSDNGQIIFSGVIKTLVNTVPYTATGTVGGGRLLLNMKTASGAYYPVFGEELNIDDEIL